jgi:hypothetical protein
MIDRHCKFLIQTPRFARHFEDQKKGLQLAYEWTELHCQSDSDPVKLDEYPLSL